MQIRDALKFVNQLESDSPRLDVEVLLAFVLGKSRTYLFTWPEAELTAAQEQEFQRCFTRRQAGEPIAFITGHKEFWSLELAVAPSTLIPRPETELLVETALAKLSEETPVRVLDLGTGTGAIALAIAKERPLAEVVGVDVSVEAIALAEGNARRNHIRNCSFLQSDWLQSVTGKFDLIVSNPPYIDRADPHLQQGDVRFEPASALVAANHGLADIQTISECARVFLKPGAFLFMEHGWQQAQAVQQILQQLHYHQVHSSYDLNQIARVTGGCV